VLEGRINMRAARRAPHAYMYPWNGSEAVTFVIKLLYQRYSNEMTSNDRVRPVIVARTSFSLTSALNVVVFACKYPAQIHVRKIKPLIILYYQIS